MAEIIYILNVYIIYILYICNSVRPSVRPSVFLSPFHAKTTQRIQLQFTGVISELLKNIIGTNRGLSNILISNATYLRKRSQKHQFFEKLKKIQK